MYWMFVQCVCECEQFWRCGVQNIHRSFVGWPGLELRIPTTFVIPGCWHLRCCGLGNCLRPHAAALGGALRPRRGGGAVALQRRRGGRHDEHRPGPQSREAGARHRGLPDLGTSEGFSGIETYAFFRKCLAKLWVFHSKNMRNMPGTMITM